MIERKGPGLSQSVWVVLGAAVGAAVGSGGGSNTGGLLAGLVLGGGIGAAISWWLARSVPRDDNADPRD